MTYLLLQTFLLLLSAYFAGAFCACLMKRALMTRSVETAAVAARTAPTAQVEYPEEIVPLVKPREIDPVQPRIEVFPRPARKVVPVEGEIDISRFNRALTGPELNEGMPRKMIVELRPAILKSPTGPAVPFKKPEPKVEAPKPEAPKVEAAKADATKPAEAVKASEPAKPVAAPAPAKPEPPKADIKDAKPAAPSKESTPAVASADAKPKTDATETPASTGASPMMAGIAGASAAAAAAVAAAKAAASSVVPRPQPPSPTPPAAEQTKPAADKPSDKPNVDRFAPDKPMSAEPAASKSEPTTIKPTPAATPAAAQQASSKPASPEPEAKPESQKPPAPQTAQVPAATPPMTGGDDLLRIRAIDTQTVAGLNSIGINRFEQIAHWTPADVNRVNQALGLSGRVDREQWIEQAQILAKGGETYYSRNRGAIVRSAAEPPPPATEKPAPQPEATPAKPAATAPSAAVSSAPAAATPAPQAAAEKPAATPPTHAPVATAPSTPAAPPGPAQAAPPAQSMTAALQGKSVAEMATAAAAAIAAASASVTRGIRPIEPISPLARANPNIVMPAKLSDAIKDNESKAPVEPATTAPTSAPVKPSGKADDLKRIRGIGVLIEKRLNAIGITTYEQVANWTAADIDRISQMLEFKGRIERESWVEHARILMSGGETEFSRRVDRGDVESSRDDS